MNEWPYCDALAPHVHIITSYKYVSNEAQLDLAHLLCWAADFDIERGMYAQAMQRAQRSLSIFERLVPERDQRLAAATWLYGRLRYYQAQTPKDIEEAAALLLRALEISDYASLNFAETAFELAHLYYDQCDGEQCLKMGKASFESWEAMGGPNSPRTLDNMHDYALELAMLGREKEGIAAWQEIIARTPATDASEDTKTIYKYRSMASIAEFEGDAAVAEILYRKLVFLGEDLYHPEHMHLYDYRLSHVEQIMLQNKFDDAIRISQVILQGCVNNSEWRIQVSCLQTIAACHNQKSNYHEEITLRRTILQLHEKNLGNNHKETTDAKDALAYSYLYLSSHDKARTLNEQILSWRHECLGSTHVDTIRSIECLGISHAYLGDHAKAEAAYLDALDRQDSPSRSNGDGHENPFVAVVDPRLSDNLQISLYHQEKWEDLEVWSRRSCEATSDETAHADYRLRAHQNLVHALERQGKAGEALEVKAGLLALSDPPGEGKLSNGVTLERVPALPPVKHRRRFGRIVHPRTWSA